MRVIAGSARHLQLKTIEGLGTRPTTDRIKETLFNMLSREIEGSRFLDLFSGSGAIGIEALSRGAKQAVFVENNRKACSVIRDNLAHTKLSDQAWVIDKDAMIALSMIENKGEPFDVIFMDPPYGHELEKRVLERLKDMKVCDEVTRIIVESDLDTGFDYLSDMGFEIVKEKIYKSNKHTFIQRI